LAEEVQGEGVKPAQGNQEGKGFQNMQHSEEHFSGIKKEMQRMKTPKSKPWQKPRKQVNSCMI